MTYVYKCDPCKIVFDIKKPAIEFRSQEKCPKCGEFAPNVIMGGNGWYFPGYGMWTGKNHNAGKGHS